jgi:hypothetical protein
MDGKRVMKTFFIGLEAICRSFRFILIYHTVQNMRPSLIAWFVVDETRVGTLRRAIVVFYVRGVLGNKCAGHHNLKTAKIREIMCK